MIWNVLLHPDFDVEFADLAEDLQDELPAHTKLLAECGLATTIIRHAPQYSNP